MSIDKLLGDILAELHSLNVNLVAANGLSKKPGAAPKPEAAQAAPSAGTGAAAATPAASPAPADTVLTYEQVADSVNKLTASGRTPEAKALLAEYGAKSLPQVPKESWAEFKGKADALLAGGKAEEPAAGLV